MSLVICNLDERSYYGFTCPDCHSDVRKHADDEIQALLMSGGVPAQHWLIPAEALERHEGPSLTYDDLLDLALALRSDEFPVHELTPLTGG